MSAAEMMAVMGASPPSVHRVSVPLTKEARKLVNERRREAAACFKEDLENAWKIIDQSIGDIAGTHRKSIQRVQKELHMGRSVLQTRRTVNAWNAWCAKIAREESSHATKNATGSDFLADMIQRRKSEYLALTEEQKKQLAEDFIPIRNTRHTARRTSVRSRINDITGTLKCVEKELGALRSRTGLESTLCAVRGSTDLNLNPVHFETEGLEGFLGNGLRVDKQDFICRLEGYCVRGVYGAAHNHRDRVAAVRSELRRVILTALRKITGDESVQMRYKDFWPKLVQRYRVQIDGWPSDVTFSNFSESSLSLSDLSSLLRKWQDGTIHWRKLTDEEYTRLENDRNEEIESGKITIRKRRTRSDTGTKRRNHGASKKARTTCVIQSSDDENGDTQGGGMAAQGDGDMAAPPTPTLPPSVASSTPGLSSGTTAAPSSATADTPAGSSSIFDDWINMNNDPTTGVNNTFGDMFGENSDLNALFDFDFGTGTAPTLTF